MTSTNNARRLAPAPSQVADDASLSIAAVPSSQITKSGIKRASTACQSCKHIKRKCDQQHPCSNCVKTNTICVYDQAQDGRRRAARKRNVEELELKRDALDTILDALRHSEDEHVEHLLHLIKTNEPLEDIIRYAAAHDGSFPEDQLASLAVAVDTGLSRKSVLSISALCDSPPIKVPARPWTRITMDDDFVSHLVSTYFNWYDPAFSCIIRDLFTDAMVSKDVNSAFCSPLLVNAILAVACHFSDHPATCQIPGDASTRGQHFMRETLRLWTEEAGCPKLTNLQACQPLAVALTLTGKDRLSMSYVDQANDLAADMLFRLKRMPETAPEYMNLRKSLRSACWSLYLISVGYGLAFMRDRSYSIPEIERPDIDDHIAEWLPYPNCEPSMRVHFGKYADFQFNLHETGAEIGSFVFCNNENQPDLRARIVAFEDRLGALQKSLPWPDENSTINPQIMDLHLVYHWLRITLFNFLKLSNSNISGDVEDIFRYAQEQCLESAQTIAGLYGRWFHDFGSRNLTVWMPQTAVSAAHVFIDHLDKPEVHDSFHDVCLVLSSISRRWMVMRGHVRMLFITVERRGQSLPERTRQLLSYVARDSWKPGDHKFFGNSTYPNYALAKGEDPRTVMMGDLLEKWANLDLDQGLSRQDTTGSEGEPAPSNVDMGVDCESSVESTPPE